MSWRLALALEQLRAEINTAAPHRSKLSDGTVGDLSHAARASDHNPNGAGVVRAMDVTHDPAGGCDADQLAEAVRRLGIAGHPALGPGAYVIRNGRIASATLDGAPWDWEPYAGSNPHTKHVHISVSSSAAGYDSTKEWGLMAVDNHVTTARGYLSAAAGLILKAARELEQTPRTRRACRAGAVASRAARRSVLGVLRFLPRS